MKKFTIPSLSLLIAISACASTATFRDPNATERDAKLDNPLDAVAGDHESAKAAVDKNIGAHEAAVLEKKGPAYTRTSAKIASMSKDSKHVEKVKTAEVHAPKAHSKKEAVVKHKEVAVAAHGASHWTYAGSSGPEHWGDLSEENSLCKNGKFQSPVNLKWNSPKSKRSIQVFYKNTPSTVVDTGHAVQVNFEAGNYVLLGGERYDLLQMHFHSRSEHTLSGKSFPLEAHLVHKNPSNGKLAVLGVFYKAGRENPYIQDVLEQSHSAESGAGKELLAKNYLPSILTHYNYEGSLTTPPCSEGVNWNVFNTPQEISVEQLASFRKLYSANYRPTQNLGDRKPANYQ